jgi:hypothetical protein
LFGEAFPGVASPESPRDPTGGRVAGFATIEPLSLFVDFVPGEEGRHSSDRFSGKVLPVNNRGSSSDSDFGSAATVCSTPFEAASRFGDHSVRRWISLGSIYVFVFFVFFFFVRLPRVTVITAVDVIVPARTVGEQVFAGLLDFVFVKVGAITASSTFGNVAR